MVFFLRLYRLIPILKSSILFPHACLKRPSGDLPDWKQLPQTLTFHWLSYVINECGHFCHLEFPEEITGVNRVSCILEDQSGKLSHYLTNDLNIWYTEFSGAVSFIHVWNYRV